MISNDPKSKAKNGKKLNKNKISIFRDFQEINLLVIIAAIWIVVSFLSEDWNTWGNVRAILMSFSIQGIVVIGMTIMLIVGGIDLSVGSVMALSMIIFGKIFLAGVNPWLAIVLTLIFAALIGAIIGFFVTKVGLSYLITTLAVMVIGRGACYVITKGTPISLYEMPENFKYIGQGQILNVIPMVVIIFIVIVIISDFLLRRSNILRKVIYTGSNEKAARFSGLNTDRIKLGVCILCSVLTGLAGILYVTKFTGAQANFGQGLEIIAISAAIIGGASLSGGKGTVLGAILGIAFLQIVTATMIMLDVSVYWQEFISGLILLLAVSVDHIRQNKKITLKK